MLLLNNAKKVKKYNYLQINMKIKTLRRVDKPIHAQNKKMLLLKELQYTNILSGI